MSSDYVLLENSHFMRQKTSLRRQITPKSSDTFEQSNLSTEITPDLQCCTLQS